jgi:hypothetical protein
VRAANLTKRFGAGVGSTALECREQFASAGPPPSNGDWPPHLHFQVTVNMIGYRGDFPGVASEIEKIQYLQLCPDPNVI